MKNKQRILFFHAGAELYGADKILHILVDGLVRRGWLVLVALPWNGELKGRLEEVGARVIVVNHGVLRRKYFNVFGLFDRLRKIVGAARSLAQVARENDISVVHTNTSVVFAGALTARLARIAHVWHIHEITTRPKFVWRTLSWLIPRLADRVVCVSSAVLSHLIAGNSANAAKGQVLHNGIAPLVPCKGDRLRIRQELGLSDDDVLVGMVGRVNNWKGQMALADAAEMVVAKYPNSRFLFVGGTFAGEEHLLADLRSRVQKSCLCGSTTVLDFREDVPAIMSAIDVFVLPSIQPDPLPTVVLEAMSLSLPIVGFAHGGVCEMVADGETGLLVAPCDVDAMAAAIGELIAKPRLRTQFGEAGAERFMRLFSVNAFLDNFEAVYENQTAR